MQPRCRPLRDWIRPAIEHLVGHLVDLDDVGMPPFVGTTVHPSCLDSVLRLDRSIYGDMFVHRRQARVLARLIADRPQPDDMDPLPEERSDDMLSSFNASSSAGGPATYGPAWGTPQGLAGQSWPDTVRASGSLRGGTWLSADCTSAVRVLTMTARRSLQVPSSTRASTVSRTHCRCTSAAFRRRPRGPEVQPGREDLSAELIEELEPFMTVHLVPVRVMSARPRRTSLRWVARITLAASVGAAVSACSVNRMGPACRTVLVFRSEAGVAISRGFLR